MCRGRKTEFPCDFAFVEDGTLPALYRHFRPLYSYFYVILFSTWKRLLAAVDLLVSVSVLVEVFWYQLLKAAVFRFLAARHAHLVRDVFIEQLKLRERETKWNYRKKWHCGLITLRQHRCYWCVFFTGVMDVSTSDFISLYLTRTTRMGGEIRDTKAIFSNLTQRDWAS